jgi:hypothetical protein
MKLSKRLRILFISLLILLILSFLFIINTYKIPEINVKVELCKLTNEEFNVLSKTDNVSIDNVKKLNIEVKITKTSKCKIRDVKIPDLNLIDRIDYIRSYELNYQEDNILKNSQAIFAKDITFNSTDLSITELKKIFNNEKIIITIVTNYNREFNYSYSIGELLEASQ